MFRVAIAFDPLARLNVYSDAAGWRVVKVWNVRDEWASRAVDVDRRSKKKRLLLLSPTKPPYLGGAVDPREILRAYLDALPEEVKVERAKS